MRIINFAKRNFKELIREPESIVFCIVLPLFLLIIFQQFKIPNEAYSIENFTPSIIIFSYSFISLFTAQLVAKDRCSLLLTRLYASPMKAREYIVGYTISIIPMAIFQSLIFFVAATFFGLDFGINTLLTILILIPISILFVAMGILIGNVTSDKSAPGLASIVIQLVAFTSGIWFSIDMVGKIYKIVCRVLPFSHTVNLSRMILNNTKGNFLESISIIIIYTILIFIISSIIFKKKMISDNK